jgi:hypothetical protein
MSSAPITSHVSQSLKIFPQLPLQLILDLHGGKFGCDCRNSFRWQGTDFRAGEDMELREDSTRVLLANAIETL